MTIPRIPTLEEVQAAFDKRITDNGTTFIVSKNGDVTEHREFSVGNDEGKLKFRRPIAINLHD